MRQTLVLLLIFFSIKGYSQNLERIFQTEQEEYFYTPNTGNTAWIKIVSEKTEFVSEKTKKKEIIDGYKMVLWKFDCDKRKLGLIHVVVYSKDGKSLQYFKQNEILVKMDYAIPETIGGRLLCIFCEN